MQFPQSIYPALLSGYSIFTTFTVENNRVKGFSHHLNRLKWNSEELFGITPERGLIVQKIKEFLETLSCSHSLVRVALFPENFNLVFPEKIEKLHIVVTGRKLHIPTQPMTLELHEMIRPLAHLKTSTLFQSLQTRKKAHLNGFSDSLFYYNDTITEGPTWNIFFGKGTTLFFPDPSQKTFLEGFTQTLLKEHIPSEYTIKVEEIQKDEISSFDYAGVLSSGVGIIPVSLINTISYSTKPIKKLQEIYKNIHAEEIV